MVKTFPPLYLRLALGAGFFIIGCDRLGVWGPYGKPWVSWGDWKHFSAYAHQVMGFLPGGLAEALAILATAAEITFGILLLLGLFTRTAAFGSGVLTACFAVSMAISFGIISPINYSVFTVSAASFLLSVQPSDRWSLDALLKSRRSGRQIIQ